MGKWIARIASLLLLGAGLWACGSGCSILRTAARTRAQEIGRSAVDLSRAGAVRIPYHHDHVHGEIWLLTVTPPAPDLDSALARLKGLAGKSRVVPPVGYPPYELPLSLEAVGRELPPDGADVVLLRTHTPGRGDSILEIEVVRPAAALAGTAQTLVARYQTSGMEAVGGCWLSIMGGFSVLVGGLLAFSGWRRRRAMSANDSSASRRS